LFTNARVFIGQLFKNFMEDLASILYEKTKEEDWGEAPKGTLFSSFHRKVNKVVVDAVAEYLSQDKDLRLKARHIGKAVKSVITRGAIPDVRESAFFIRRNSNPFLYADDRIVPLKCSTQYLFCSASLNPNLTNLLQMEYEFENS
jgi:hypothetical protein